MKILKNYKTRYGGKEFWNKLTLHTFAYINTAYIYSSWYEYDDNNLIIPNFSRDSETIMNK